MSDVAIDVHSTHCFTVENQKQCVCTRDSFEVQTPTSFDYWNESFANNLKGYVFQRHAGSWSYRLVWDATDRVIVDGRLRSKHLAARAILDAVVSLQAEAQHDRKYS